MLDLRYPIGKFRAQATYTQHEIDHAIATIAAFPSRLFALVKDLDEEKLATTYRPEGWTVRQVIHHLPDSHANAYIRFKLALTEDNPTIKTYEEDRWAELEEAKHGSVQMSLEL